jgi:hypothetical protein
MKGGAGYQTPATPTSTIGADGGTAKKKRRPRTSGAGKTPKSKTADGGGAELV